MSYLDDSRAEHWPEHSISFAPILSYLRKYWHVALGASLFGAFASALLTTSFPKYEASGFYYTPGWTLAEYKRFRSEFGSGDDLQAYFAKSSAQQSDAATLLIALAQQPRFWENSVRPLYPITKKDAKEIFETTKDKESSSIIGLELRLPAGTPEDARATVITLGEYLSQTLLLTTLQGWITAGQAASNAELLKAENQVLQTRYALEQTRARIEDLRALQTKYPEAQRMDTRQVVSADAASARYLSPIAQVIALESSVAEMNEGLRRMERRERQLKMEGAFFDKAAAASRSILRGGPLLDHLQRLRVDVFDDTDESDGAIREVANRFALDLKAFRDQFSTGFGFRSPVLTPSRSLRSVAKHTLLGGLIGTLAGAFAAVAFGWWRSASASHLRAPTQIPPVRGALRAAE